MTDTIVIAGAGHAAGQTVVSLRHGGFDGRLVLIGEEAYLPYQRPPLSKKFLAGEIEAERLLVRSEQFYADHQVDVRLSTRVEKMDRGRKSLLLSNGSHLNYDKLVLATGSHVRRINIPGSNLHGVEYLRTIDDVEHIRQNFRAGARLVVVGAGYIGLEVAAVGITLGLKVTVIELAEHIMARVEAPPVSRFFERVHREAGVDIRCCTGVKAFLGGDHVEKVVCTTGEEVAADLVIVGVGILPTTELAEGAGIPCDNGILVDEFCRTGDPDVLAIGDCTNHPNPLLGRRLRLESVHNAQEQAKTAAATILGKLTPYAEIPWFWSDQYDLKLQIVGLSSTDHEAILRGEPGGRSFAVFFLDRGRLMAVHAINSPREFMLSKKLIAAGARPDPRLLADNKVPFREIAESLGA